MVCTTAAHARSGLEYQGQDGPLLLSLLSVESGAEAGLQCITVTEALILLWCQQGHALSDAVGSAAVLWLATHVPFVRKSRAQGGADERIARDAVWAAEETPSNMNTSIGLCLRGQPVLWRAPVRV